MNKLKMDKNLNVRPESIKLLEEIIGKKREEITLLTLLLAILFWMCLLRQGKQKKKKWDYIKQKIFCTAKKTINKTKRQPTK